MLILAIKIRFDNHLSFDIIIKWAVGAVGSASAWHAEGHRFKSGTVHQINNFILVLSKTLIKTHMIFNRNNFKLEVENFSGLVLVEFFALWCGPCKMMSPIIEEIIKENKDDNIKIGKIDIDENQEIAAQYNVMSIPTFIVFKNGKVADQKIGYGSKEDIKDLIIKNK